jgi:hypothetical protein
METSKSLSNATPELERPQSAWCYFLLAHFDHLVNLVWFLVADPILVEHVMIHALVQLETIPFDASDALLAFEQARRVLISEAVGVLNAQRESAVAHGPEKVDDPPDFRRLAFVLAQVSQSPAHSSLPETQELICANEPKWPL